MNWPQITSRQNQRLKDVAHLRERRQRKAHGRTVIDGARELLRALEAGVPIIEAFVCPERVRKDEARRAVELLGQLCKSIWSITPELYDQLAYGGRDDGVVAVAEPKGRSLAEFSLPPQPLVAVLEGVEKPGNVGAVLRSADAAGVTGLIVADSGTDLYNPNTIRASLGTVFSVPTFAASSAQALEWLVAHGLAIFAARLGAAKRYTEVDLTRPAAIVLGSEAEGLSQAWNRDEVVGVEIPMLGSADSLNVSVAAAVLFYEAVRQRGG
ncbi:MAG TPA: RNA methyltransferase [Pirellulales bacterium]|nr:RNA methyltransferase [Pirellulales bacterium]